MIEITQILSCKQQHILFIPQQKDRGEYEHLEQESDRTFDLERK